MSDATRIVDAATGEITEPCSEERARALTGRIRSHLGYALEQITAAYTERAWVALGYDGWDDYVAGEFGRSTLAVPREDRREVVGSLRDAGMSLRAIASATGTGYGTAHRELAGDPNGSPAPAAEVTGRDGKTYPARVTERSSESTTVEYADEAQSDAEPDDYDDRADEPPPLDPSKRPGAEDRAYVRAYLKALRAAQVPHRFDPERLGELLSADEAEQVEIVANGNRRHADAIKRARSGLRAIEGGRQ